MQISTASVSFCMLQKEKFLVIKQNKSEIIIFITNDEIEELIAELKELQYAV